MSIVELLYQGAVLVLSPLVAFVFLFFERGRARLGERFGAWRHDRRFAIGEPILWLHAASNGEVRGLLPLLRRLKHDQPQLPVMLTATSVSAFNLLGEFDIEVHLAPFDSLLFYRRALAGRSYRALLVAETEIWPGMLKAASERKIPVMVVNARISDYTAGIYQRLAPILRSAMSRIRRVCCADRLSVERFRGLGVGSVTLTGNMKYDSTPSLKSEQDRTRFRKQFPLIDGPLIVLGSLRPGEETIWIKGLTELARTGPIPGCILAPRHLEKVGYFYEKLRESGLAVMRYSELSADVQPPDCDVILLDTFGLLEGCYALAALSFIGGSLVDVGGHNPLEAAAYASPIVIGPFDSTVQEVTAQLEEVDALIRVTGDGSVVALLERVMRGDLTLKERGIRAQSVWLANQGATERVLRMLTEEDLLPAPFKGQRQSLQGKEITS